MSEYAVKVASPRVQFARIPGVAFALIALLVVFAATNPRFVEPINLSNVLVQSSVLLLLALPMTLIIMTEGLDLSIGAVLTLASVVLALTVVTTHSPLLSVLAAVIVGGAFGVLNGFLVALVEIPPFVATLGTLGAAQSLALIVSDGQSIVGIPRAVREVYSGNFFGLPSPILIAALGYLMFHMLLYRTRFGTYVFALGGNREALALAGIRWRLPLIGTYALAGLTAGFAALLLTARMSAGHPTAAIGMEFDAIAAVALGGTSFERGDGWLAGTLLGVVTIGVLRNGLSLLALPSSMQVACTGLLVIAALFIDGLRKRTT